MPIDYAFDLDLGLLAVRYSGSVRTSEIVDAMTGMGELASQSESYAVLLLFEPKVDLSAVDVESLKLIKQSEQEVFKRLDLRRRASAAILDGSTEARLVLPLWNALCEMDGNTNFDFEPFRKADEALAWLGIPLDQGRSLIAGIAPVET